MTEPQNTNASRYPLWRLFWWATFFCLALGILRADGPLAIVPTVALGLLFMAQAWLDRTERVR